MASFQLPFGVVAVGELRGHSALVEDLEWSPDGGFLATASGDGRVQVWNVDGGRLVRLNVNRAGVRAVSFSLDGHWLATGGRNGSVRLWDTTAWKRRPIPARFRPIEDVAFAADGSLLVLAEDRLTRCVGEDLRPAQVYETREARRVATGADPQDFAIATQNGISTWTIERQWNLTSPLGAWDVAFDPGGRTFAVAGANGAILIGDLRERLLRATFEGHTSTVAAVSYSADGRLLASRSEDDVRIWDLRSGECIASFGGLEPGAYPPRLAFHPQRPLLAVSNGEAVHLFDVERQPFDVAPARAVRYTSAKIVLVGESGVGKTGLGWRLAHGDFKEHASTHGQQFWALDELDHTRADGAKCEAVLWDLAGQPDYRLVHALFLDDADLALVVFDPTRDDDPLRAVEYWLDQLENAKVLLVAARADRGTSRIMRDEIEAFCAAREVTSFHVTSALSGEGLEALVGRIRETIPWERKPATITTETFKRIKDDVLALREDPDQPVIVSTGQLRAILDRDPDLGTFTDDEMLTAVGHLSNHGYVARLTTSEGDVLTLLAPELLNNVAASIVLEARRDARELGSLEEEKVLSNTYRFRELEELGNDDREVLLDAAVAMFLAHNVCFRETNPLTRRSYLVFPELINLRKPDIEAERPVEDGPSYSVRGAVQNVYARLVVLLGYTDTFARADQWHNQARYVVGKDHVCGFRVTGDRAGRLEFVLYFDLAMERDQRQLFESLFESFLKRAELDVLRYRPVICAKGHRINRDVVREALAAERTDLFCNHCGQRVAIDAAEASLTRAAPAGAAFADEQRTVDTRSRFEQVLFRLTAHTTQAELEAPECFISYAWGDQNHERWVERFANDLLKGGVDVILDRWENSRIGASVPRFVERVANADRVIVVGTPLYRRKYVNGEPMRGYVVAAEGDLIGHRMLGTEAGKEEVLPVLVDGDSSSFPDLLRPRVYADFRDADRYFATMLEVLLSLYKIGPREAVAIELRSILDAGFD